MAAARGNGVPYARVPAKIRCDPVVGVKGAKKGDPGPRAVHLARATARLGVTTGPGVTWASTGEGSEVFGVAGGGCRRAS
jgi:hypothetical protein